MWNEISCTKLQLPPETLTRGLPPPDPRSLCPLSSTEFVEPLPKKIPGYATAEGGGDEIENYSVFPLINGLSDHDAQVFSLFNIIVPDDRNEFYFYRKIINTRYMNSKLA
jgi:hypothetical protein